MITVIMFRFPWVSVGLALCVPPKIAWERPIVYEARRIVYVDAHARERSSGYPYYLDFYQNDTLLIDLK